MRSRSLSHAAACAVTALVLAACGVVTAAAPASANHVAAMTVTQVANQGAYVTLQVDLTYSGAVGGSYVYWSTGNGRSGSFADGVTNGAYAGDASGTGTLSGGSGAFASFTWVRTQPAPNVARTRITYAYGQSGVYQVSWDDCCPDVAGTTAVSVAASFPACSDATDNDGDGWTDWPADPGCESADDTSEFADCPPVAGVKFCLEAGTEVFRATAYNVDVTIPPTHVEVGRVDLYEFRAAVVSVRLPCVIVTGSGTNPCAAAGGTYVSTITTLAVKAGTPHAEIGQPIASVGICNAELVATVLDVGVTSAPALTVCETGTVSL